MTAIPREGRIKAEERHGAGVPVIGVVFVVEVSSAVDDSCIE